MVCIEHLPLFMKRLQPLSTPYLSITLPITMLPTVNKTEQYFIVKNHSLYMTMKNISTSVCNPYHPCA